MDKKEIEFLPFHAINEFMLDDYRVSVIQKVFKSQEFLPVDQKNAINQMVKKYFVISGFRNSSVAPIGLKVKEALKSFERNPEVVARILMAWSELNLELRQKVYDMLNSRGWELLPPETDRTKLPGFLISWPENETYEVLGQAYCEMFPDGKDVSENDIRLMIVWLSGRLPYQITS